MAITMIMNNNNNDNNFPMNPLHQVPAGTKPKRAPVILGLYRSELNVSTSPVVSSKRKKRPLHEQADGEAHDSCAAASTKIEEPLSKKQRSSNDNGTTASRQRRVRFDSNATSTHSISRIQEMDAPNVWYSGSEIVQGRYCDSYYVNFYATTSANAMNTGKSSAVVGADEYRQDLFHALGAACGKLKPDARPLLALSQSDCRGLEREMTPCFQQRKKQVVTNVLQSQAALKEHWTADDENLQQQQRKGAEILAAHYHKLALPATRFARLLAQGDAMLVARERHTQEQQRS